MQGTWVWSLVWEPRSNTVWHGQEKKKDESGNKWCGCEMEVHMHSWGWRWQSGHAVGRIMAFPKDAVPCWVTQSCPTLFDPMDCSLPGSSVHGDSPGKNTGVGCCALLQGIFPTQGLNPGLAHCRWILYHLSHQGSPRILEWLAYPFSRGFSQPRDQTQVSHIASSFFTSDNPGNSNLEITVNSICAPRKTQTRFS